MQSSTVRHLPAPQPARPDAENVIPLETAGTLYGLFRERIRRSADHAAYRQYDRDSEQWHDYSWADVGAMTAQMQAAMRNSGLQDGDRVAIMLRNSVEWVAWDQAALGLGLILVPLYTNDRADNVAYCIQNSGSKLLLIDGGRQWRDLGPALQDVDCLRTVVYQRELTGGDDDSGRTLSLQDWLAPHQQAELCDDASDAGDADRCASIVYTSGTTGRPKGVMLSHMNMLWDAHAATRVLAPTPDDRFLSFLPMSHTLERTGGLYLPMFCGTPVSYARSVNQLADDFKTQQPTILISVPRIFEMIFGRIQEQMKKRGAAASFIFNLAVNAGWRHFEYQNGRAGWHPLLLLRPLLQRKIGRTLLDRFGGHIRICVSGGAALSPEVARLFLALGLPILQGYGLTEHSPVIAVNPVERNNPRSVGPPLPGVEARLGDGDELQVRSPAVMLGYWENPTATAELLDEDGWLATGDCARFDQGAIVITGRIKEILVLSNGEKVPPNDMELAVTVDPLFEQIMIVGEARPNLTAMIVLNREHWKALANKLKLDPDDPASLADSGLKRQLKKQLGKLTRDFPGYAQIRDFALTLEPWTIENGLLTATLKMRRNRIHERHQQEIDALYDKR